MATVTFKDATRTYPKTDVPAVNRLNLEVQDGEFLVLVGPSGCGKTTTLRMLAGLENVDEGTILIDDRSVVNLAPRDRDIAMVFQNYALYPHMNVFDNMGFALRLAKVPKREIAERVHAAAKTLDLESYLDRKPRQLSGGQRQRVAMGRAIVRQPRVYLMDEPLSNLDAKLRVQMRADIKKLQSDLGVTTIYVTHDQVEAMTLGQRVAVMRKGELQQVDGPEVLYNRPRNVFVGGFIGSPAMNMLEAKIEREDGNVTVLLGDSQITLDAATATAHPALAAYDGRVIVLGIRPEGLEDAALASGEHRSRLKSKVELREALGSEILLHVSVAAQRAITEEVRELAEDVGDDRVMHTGTEANTTIVARVSPHTKVRENETIELAIDETTLHFFDPETGLVIEDQPPPATAGAPS